MQRLLIVDDDEDIVSLLTNFFSKHQFEVISAEDGKTAVSKLKNEVVDLAICDFKLPDYNGIELLQKLKIIAPDIAVIIIAGYADVKIAVDALKKGASDYVTKPLYPDEILHSVNSALARRRQKSEEQKQTKRAPDKREFIQGSSKGAKRVKKHVDLVAPTNMSVIIQGETGTGKEYIARAIHEKSRRNQEPFVAIDCGALPNELAGSELFGHIKGAFTGAVTDKAGCFEAADGGTLFLDEIGNLSYENQIKLLRAIQEQKIKRIGSNKEVKINVRILAATNEELKDAVRKGEFREDLYHRLNEFSIQLSPLRDRVDDIMLFASFFLKRSNLELFKSVNSFSSSAEKALKLYRWPGNLRELKNVIKRAVLLCEEKTITTQHLRDEITDPDYFSFAKEGADENEEVEVTDLKSIVAKAEKKAIEQVLKQTAYNKSKTADILKVDRKTLYNKMKVYDIDDQPPIK